MFTAQDTIAQARNKLASVLAGAGKEPAALEARLLLESVTGLRPLELLTRANERLDPNSAAQLQNFAQRRLADEPISRILGRSGFFGLDLLVTPDVLDPRADTETLVACAVNFMRERGQATSCVLDLGTGSGAILCAILSLLPDAFGVGVDLSPAACVVARSNLERCGLVERSTVICGDWADALHGPFDLVVCNPPYIGLGEKADLGREVAGHDPHLALFGGADGLDCYRRIARDLGRLLKPGGGAFFEIGWKQASDVLNILGDNSLSAGRVTKDAEGRDRVVGVIKA